MRKKRDRSERAYKLGYNQGIQGHDKSMCPFDSQLKLREEWLGGWRKGHFEFVSGYRMPEFS